MKMLSWSNLFKTAILCLLLFVPVSCGKQLPSELNENNTPAEIIKLGDEAYAKGYFEQAGDYYLEVNKYFPYSLEDELALSKAVESYYRAKEFEDCRIASSKFIAVYPESVKAKRVLYFRAKSFCDEIDIVERDQAAARDCIASFSSFKSLYPKSKYGQEVEKSISTASEFLIGQQLNIGKYYLERNNPTAALRRFKKVKNTTKGSDFLPEVSYRLVESFLLLGLSDEALSETRYMEKKFPNNSWTNDAVKLMVKLGYN